ncbi:CHAD domain-containing protein [Nitratiruptor sp. YY09-18]|uniref:CYTH and CHAD domain-containing protein n=1 Tax=Nitratiruptor sp. YY09-18 TaxID=2724901 RepID=UPI0019161BA2|nr:CHAD domain-containing protein [Nitratiruptor sp. YY09-18]BCD67172.1 adenylate cyclase [Nitratiruptor sp. YY09-18]
MESKEIERKYILPPCNPKRLLKFLGIPYQKSKIVQFYTPDHIRYRQRNGHFYKTIKKGEGIERTEIEHLITKEEFAKAFMHAQGAIIHKTRYLATIEGRIYEFDWFKDQLRGLAFLEVEFPSLQEAKEFTPPPKIAQIILDEVTKNPNFTNASLALHGMPIIDADLTKLLEDAKSAAVNRLQAKVILNFHPYHDISYLLKATIYALLHIILNNKNAILAGDQDSERLHQLRIAMRKIRSYLTLFSHIHTVPKDLQKELSYVMKQTNRARDIDVALAWMEEYKKELPPNLEHHLDAIIKELQKQKAKSDKELHEFLHSEAFKKVLADLAEFCQKVEIANLPAIIAAKRLLKKELKRIKKMSKNLSKKSYPKDFHKMRIEAKKLRYLLELFQTILEPRYFKKALTLAKEFQTILGEHQDFVVQIDYLRQLQQEHKNKALAYLVEFLEKKAKKRRKKFLEKRKKLKMLPSFIQDALCRYEVN